jgi:hypothetical protein
MRLGDSVTRYPIGCVSCGQMHEHNRYQGGGWVITLLRYMTGKHVASSAGPNIILYLSYSPSPL